MIINNNKYSTMARSDNYNNPETILHHIDIIVESATPF
jgi:hypothetical protein